MGERYLSKAKKLLFHPSQFYKSIEPDKAYSKAMFFYVNTIIISVVISIIASLIVSSITGTLTASSFFSSIAGYIMNIGLAFLIPFVAAGITHLGVLMFRGKQGYQNSYKIVAYSFAIMGIYGMLSTIVLNIVALIAPITATDPALMIQDPNFIKSMIVFGIIALISIIHSLAFQVGGISKFQKMSKLRAFFAIIIIPLILFILFAVVVIWAILSSSILQAAG